MAEVVHGLRKTHCNKLREETIEMPRTFNLSKYLYVAMGSILLLSAIFCVPAFSQDNGAQLTEPPTGQNNNIEMWKAVRGGIQGQVSIPDKKAGVLVQPEGEEWRSIRNGPISNYGAWVLLGTIALLALFFTIKGRIRIEGGITGKTIQRFMLFERMVHWIVALTFIILSLTGLNLLYGRYIIKPWLGADTFATITLMGKMAHNYLGIVFIVGIVVMFVLWIKHNIPTKIDLVWLAKGGGMLKAGTHPPAQKFNAGQKIIFAAVVVGGTLISYSGLMLLFPFSGDTTVQDMQSVQLLHTIGALVLTAIILAHIYIGTIGMEGAIHAMWSGNVEETWAKEHHSIWYAEVKSSDRKSSEGDTSLHSPPPNPAE